MSLSQLLKLPYDERSKLFHSISEVVEKVEGDRDGEQINRIEKDLTRFLVRAHNARATEGVREAVNSITGPSDSPFSEEDEENVVQALEDAFDGIAEETIGRFNEDIDQIYRIGKVKFVEQFDARAVRDTEQKAPFPKSENFQKMVRHVEKINELGEGIDFSSIDQAAIDNLTRLTQISIGDHFAKTLKPRVAASIQKNVFAKGLNKQEAGEFLQSELTRINGGNAFDAVPPAIRRQGLNGVNAYYEGLSSTNVTLSRNFANISAMDEAEIQQLVFSAVVDRRTSNICLQMNGRIFTIEQARGFRDQVFNAEDVEDLKSFATWRKDLSEFGLSAGQQLNDPQTSARLARNGVIVPPLHFRCRSELFPA